MLPEHAQSDEIFPEFPIDFLDSLSEPLIFFRDGIIHIEKRELLRSGLSEVTEHDASRTIGDIRIEVAHKKITHRTEKQSPVDRPFSEVVRKYISPKLLIAKIEHDTASFEIVRHEILIGSLEVRKDFFPQKISIGRHRIIE